MFIKQTEIFEFFKIVYLLLLQNSKSMSFDSKNGSIQVKIENKIATITFGNATSNSFPSTLLRELTTIFGQLSQNINVNIVVLQSHGEKVFCSGASFDELLLISNFEQGKAFFEGFANVINAMRCCSKIIVGRVHAKAVGGGVGLASACDYVFATKNASIKLSELAIGIGPFVIEPAVSRKIGNTATTALTLDTTNWKSAQWAHEKGLFTEIFETKALMQEALNTFTNQLSNYNIDALVALKKLFWQNTDHWQTLLPERATISGELILSEFSKNALQIFKSK